MTAGCSFPNDDETRVAELRVMAVVMEPPEVVPGETLRFDVHLLDPQRGGADLLLWLCTPVDGACLEAEASPPLAGWTRVVRRAGDVTALEIAVPAELAPYLGGEARTASLLGWALACAPGRCPVIDAVADADPDAPAPAEVLASLSDPELMLRGLPKTGVSLAARPVVITGRPEGERNLNPVVFRLGEGDLVVRTGGTYLVQLAYADVAYAWPYATIGGFEYDRYVAGGSAGALRFVAPEDPGTGEVLIVVTDGVGGEAVWREPVRVTR